MSPHEPDPAHDPAHGVHDHGVRSEDDRIATGKLLFVGVASLVVFFIASAIAVSYLRMKQAEHPPFVIPPEIGQSKIGIVEQTMFELQVRGVRDRAARLERLRSYGWVDRAGGVVHVPIDVAMDLVANGVRPAPDSMPATTSAPGAQP